MQIDWRALFCSILDTYLIYGDLSGVRYMMMLMMEKIDDGFDWMMTNGLCFGLSSYVYIGNDRLTQDSSVSLK